MLTVDFGRLPTGPGTRVLDLGCGAGRHAFESVGRGAHVVALDTDLGELRSVRATAAAMNEAGEIPAAGRAGCAAGNATAMPFADGSFDVIIAAEVLEHIRADQAALREIVRVLAPGGTAAVTVPAWLPERICWRLSADYHNVPGGHVRIFTRRELETKLAAAGLIVAGHHHAHALHSPYWWLKCAVGVHNDRHPLASAYHRLLVWDIMKHPKITRLAERALNPVIGKSLIIYATKEATPRPGGTTEVPAATAGEAGPSGWQVSPAPTGVTLSDNGTTEMPAATTGEAGPSGWQGGSGGRAPRTGGPGVTPRASRAHAGA